MNGAHTLWFGGGLGKETHPLNITHARGEVRGREGVWGIAIITLHAVRNNNFVVFCVSNLKRHSDSKRRDCVHQVDGRDQHR